MMKSAENINHFRFDDEGTHSPIPFQPLTTLDQLSNELESPIKPFSFPGNMRGKDVIRGHLNLVKEGESFDGS